MSSWLLSSISVEYVFSSAVRSILSSFAKHGFIIQSFHPNLSQILFYNIIPRKLQVSSLLISSRPWFSAVWCDTPYIPTTGERISQLQTDCFWSDGFFFLFNEIFAWIIQPKFPFNSYFIGCIFTTYVIAFFFFWMISFLSCVLVLLKFTSAAKYYSNLLLVNTHITFYIYIKYEKHTKELGSI